MTDQNPPSAASETTPQPAQASASPEPKPTVTPEPTPTPAPTTAPATVPAGPQTALIVDDNFHNRNIFKIALESVGYDVKESEDGLEGVAMLENCTFDLLILDLQMPNMDGRKVLRKVKAQTIHSKMKVIIVTANAHMATSDVDDLADYIMYKPIDVLEFSGFAKRLQQTATESTPPVTG